MNNDISTDKIVKMVNENNVNRKIAEYIVEKFRVKPDDLDMIAVRDFVKRLNNAGVSAENILDGKADVQILYFVRIYMAGRESVIKDDEQSKVPIETTKKKLNKKVIIGIIAGLLAGASLIAYIAPKIKRMTMENEISDALGMHVAEVNSQDYKDRKSIVAQNTYPVGYDEHENEIYAYNYHQIARDIMDVCISDPSLFETCMHNVYFDLNINRLEGMDTILKDLKWFLQRDPALNDIFKKVEDCDVFLDYIIQSGFGNPNDPEYHKLLKDIETYKEKKETYTIAFNGLEKEAQQRIERLIELYRDNIYVLYEEYKDSLEEGEEFGTR